MKRKIFVMMASCLAGIALVLASCAPAIVEEEEKAPVEEKKKEEVKKEEVVAPKKEMVKVTLKKTDGTIVEKMVEKPKYGGTLTIVKHTSPLGFDQALGYRASRTPPNLYGEDLLQGDWTKGLSGTGEASFQRFMMPGVNQITGCLAESWETKDDTTLILHIRKGVYFHNKPPVNGREMTAEDIVASINRVLDTPTTPHYSVCSREKNIESITMPDRWTVVIKAKPGQLGTVFMWLANRANMVPREVIEKYGAMSDWRNACGTGPFMLVDYVSGSSLTFVKNPNYWMKDPIFPENQLPYVDKMTWLIIPDHSTRLAAMRTGKVDLNSWRVLIFPVDAQSLIKSNPELGVIEVAGAKDWALYINRANPPFNDIKVRRAISLAIDQQKIVREHFRGNTFPPIMPVADIPDNQHLHTPLEQMPQSVRELFEYKPDKAKQLLTEAGYPNGFETHVICSAPDADLMSICKEYLAAVGIDMEIVVKDNASWKSYGLQKHFTQLYFYDCSGSDTYGYGYLRPGGPRNFSDIDDPVVNEALAELDKAFFDEAERARILKGLAPYLLDQVYNVLLGNGPDFRFWQPWIHNYNGEVGVGFAAYYNFTKYIWIDEDLKTK